MQNEENKEIDQNKSSHGCLVSIVTIIVVVAIVFCGIYFFGKRTATNEDVTINQGDIGLMSYSFTFIPQSDIDDLEFKISFYDSSKKYISSITKNVGDVKKAKQYTVTINLTELSLNQVFSNYVSVEVSNGKTHLISL